MSVRSAFTMHPREECCPPSFEGCAILETLRLPKVATSCGIDFSCCASLLVQLSKMGSKAIRTLRAKLLFREVRSLVATRTESS